MNRLIIAAAIVGLATGAAFADEKKADKKIEKKAEKSAEKKEDKKVHCYGINSCKGKSECAVEGANGCSGANECKGKGWISVSVKECNDKHGKVIN